MRSPECCSGNLIRPGVTRFATNYITLQSIIDKRNGLKYIFNSQVWYKYHESDTPIGRRINSIINSESFWKDVRKIVSIMKPISKILRLMDSDKKPTIDFLYKTMKLMKNIVKDTVYISSKRYLKIIEER